MEGNIGQAGMASSSRRSHPGKSISNNDGSWSTIMDLLQRDLTAEQFQRLSSSLQSVSLAGGILTLIVNDEADRGWMESYLQATLLARAAEVASEIHEVRFVVEDRTGKQEQQAKDLGREKSETKIRASEVWTEICARLSASGLSDSAVKRGLEGVKALGFRGETGNLFISAPDSGRIEWLKENLGHAITQLLREKLGSSSALPEFVIGDNEPEEDQPETNNVDLDRAWKAVLDQLQMEMPKASFNTWVRDTQALGFKDGILTIGAGNAYAAEWLESRLTSTVNRLLIGILNDQAEVRFVTPDRDHQPDGQASTEVGLEDDENTEVSADDGADVRARFAYISRYQEIVKPHRVIVLEGYILRLLPEIGPRRFWTYVGFRQAGWSFSKGAAKGALTFRVPVSHIARYAGISRATLFSWMSKKDFWRLLAGLVEKTQEDPKWVVGPDSRKHQAANEYTVQMTLPLSWADALALRSWLSDRLEKMSLSEALRTALEIPAGQLVGEIFLPIGAQPSLKELRSRLPVRPMTVADIIRDLSNKKLSKDNQLMAEALHTKIVMAFGTIGIPHYFIEQVIPQARLTPEQAALIIAIRSRCYANPKTGEIRNKVVVGGGFEELAAWIGLNRTKTVWEWLTGRTDKKELDGARRVVRRETIKGDGPMPAFVRIEGELRRGAVSSEKQITVRLMEPLFGGTQTHNNGGTRTHRNSGTWTHSNGGTATLTNDGTQTGLWRNWDGLNDSYNLLLTLGISKGTITNITGSQAGDSTIPLKWSLGALLVQNEIYPTNIKKMLGRDVDPQHVVSWLLYCFSSAGSNLRPEDTIVSNLLHKDSTETPGDPYDRLANLPPRLLYELVKATRPYPSGSEKIGNSDWDRTVGSSNPRIGELRRRLFGEK